MGSVIADAQVGQALGVRFDPAAAATHGIAIRIGASPTVRPPGGHRQRLDLRQADRAEHHHPPLRFAPISASRNDLQR
ncbi:hypothetical protein [Nonomuraea sp. NPDC049784]|uniref:hypothetical protein n=1 Tax=Nonomuraea sp. NPDC049784 TaxID=3154361 RepID=UPI0033C75B5D